MEAKARQNSTKKIKEINFSQQQERRPGTSLDRKSYNKVNKMKSICKPGKTKNWFDRIWIGPTRRTPLVKMRDSRINKQNKAAVCLLTLRVKMLMFKINKTSLIHC